MGLFDIFKNKNVPPKVKDYELFKQDVNPKDYLEHYGTPRHSGRYPWGSGDTPYQHNGDFLSRNDELKKQGMTEVERAKALGLKNTSELRNKISQANSERRDYNYERAKALRDKGYSYRGIAEIMGLPNESSARSILNEQSAQNTNRAKATADILKNQIDSKGLIDVGTGVNLELGVTDTKLKNALALLEQEGYRTVNLRVDQVTNPGKKTILKVLIKDDPEWANLSEEAASKAAYRYAYKNIDRIQSISDIQSPDGGETFKSFQYPASISSKRIAVRYDEDGGTERDGSIEIRPGVADLNLGASHYAQVRIAVDGTHYIKGMAIYSDDIPEGYDILVNSNKKKGTPLTSSDPDAKQVLKPMKVDKATGEIDKDNPFGALVKANGQSEYTDSKGVKRLSAINKLREEGDYDDYQKSLSPQMLGKQKYELITRQLNLTYAKKESEFEEICSLTNPVVKKQLLESFADDCDASAVHLKAAALPRQSTKVLLPVPSLKDNEIYAPSYKNGEHVVLIRYPHGGTFEIPELVVNNTQQKAKKLLGNAIDAVGINLNVASKLSGADFDGDTAVVIPVNNKVRITTSKSLPELENFDPKGQYPYRPGMQVMKKNNVGKEMGKVSNLITDMTIQGAPPEKIARAVKHSMVVIDAYKHKLDYKKSEIDNDIESLKKEYQQNPDKKKGYGGAATLLSRSKSVEYVPERKVFFYSKSNIDPTTGEKIERETGRVKKKTGELVTQKSTSMYEAKDAFTLSSGTDKEAAYANYANRMKALGNEARKEYLRTGNLEYNPTANKTYAKEVASLQSKLKIALSNSPKERMAQVLANTIVKGKLQDNPGIEKDEEKKIRAQALAKARVTTGANKQRIDFTEREWEAIQAGAVSGTVLKNMLKNTDTDVVKRLATPKQTPTISDAKQARIRSLNAQGATIEQIADALGISTSTVTKYMKG